MAWTGTGMSRESEDWMDDEIDVEKVEKWKRRGIGRSMGTA